MNTVTSPSGTPEAVPEITDVQQITFSERGAAVPEIEAFTLTRAEKGTEIRLKLGAGGEYVHIDIPERMARVRKILEKHRVGQWNGFCAESPVPLSGMRFQLDVTFTDGTKLTASGENEYPEGYAAVKQELEKLTAPAVQAWNDARFPKVIKDKNMRAFSISIGKADALSQFTFYLEKRPELPSGGFTQINVNTWTDEAHTKPIDCFYYGSAPDAPFDALQKLVNKYRLAAWNGFNKELPYDQRKRSFKLIVEYASGEQIVASGSALPERYKQVETALIRLIWDYVEAHRQLFTPQD